MYFKFGVIDYISEENIKMVKRKKHVNFFNFIHHIKNFINKVLKRLNTRKIF